MHVRLRCAAWFQWVSSRTQNILSGLSLPHIYIIKMRREYKEVTEGTTVKMGALSKLSLAPLAKRPWPQSYPLQGRTGGNGDYRGERAREMVIGKKRKTDKTYRNKRVIVTDMGLKIFRYIGTKREREWYEGEYSFYLCNSDDDNDDDLSAFHMHLNIFCSVMDPHRPWTPAVNYYVYYISLMNIMILHRLSRSAPSGMEFVATTFRTKISVSMQEWSNLAQTGLSCFDYITAMLCATLCVLLRSMAFQTPMCTQLCTSACMKTHT